MEAKQLKSTKIWVTELSWRAHRGASRFIETGVTDFWKWRPTLLVLSNHSPVSVARLANSSLSTFYHRKAKKVLVHLKVLFSQRPESKWWPTSRLNPSFSFWTLNESDMDKKVSPFFQFFWWRVESWFKCPRVESLWYTLVALKEDCIPQRWTVCHFNAW